MSEYTPTSDQVRQNTIIRDGASYEVSFAEFDLWLSELIRKEREEAWTEGFDRGFYRGQVLPGDQDACEAGIKNPYEKE